MLLPAPLGVSNLIRQVSVRELQDAIELARQRLSDKLANKDNYLSGYEGPLHGTSCIVLNKKPLRREVVREFNPENHYGVHWYIVIDEYAASRNYQDDYSSFIRFSGYDIAISLVALIAFVLGVVAGHFS